MHDKPTAPATLLPAELEPEVVVACEAAGLQARHITPKTYFDCVMPAFVWVYSDGEVDITPKTNSDPELIDQFGFTRVASGRFTRALQELRRTSDPIMAELLVRAAGRAATACAYLSVTDTDSVQQAIPNISLELKNPHKPQVVSEQHKLRLPKLPDVVVEYGPGLMGLHFIKQQLGMVRTGQKPYRYVGITKGPFVKDFLNAYLYYRSGDENVYRTFREQGLVLLRDEGMATASASIIHSSERLTGSAEIADVLFASGVSEADPREYETGIVNAYTLLKLGGVLVIKVLKEPSFKHIAEKSALGFALKAGFEPGKIKRYYVPVKGEGNTGATGVIMFLTK